MKKNYEAPALEVVKFEYRDQVVVASGCSSAQFKNWDAGGQGYCDTDHETTPNQ